MGVVKRHQSVAPVKYFKDYISFVIVSFGKTVKQCDLNSGIYSWVQFTYYILNLQSRRIRKFALISTRINLISLIEY